MWIICTCTFLVPSLKWRGKEDYLIMGQKSSSLVLQCLLSYVVPVKLLGRIQAAFFLSAEHIRKLKPRGFFLTEENQTKVCAWDVVKWGGACQSSSFSTWPRLQHRLGKYPAGRNPRSRLSLQGRWGQLFVFLTTLLCVQRSFLFLYAHCARVWISASVTFLPVENPSGLLHDGQVPFAFMLPAIIIPLCFPVQRKKALWISSCKAVNRKGCLSVSLFLCLIGSGCGITKHRLQRL